MAIPFNEMITMLPCDDSGKNALKSSEIYDRVQSKGSFTLPESIVENIKKFINHEPLESEQFSSLKTAITEVEDPDLKFLIVVVLMSLINHNNKEKETKFQLCQLVGEFSDFTAKVLKKDIDRGIINFIGNYQIVDKIPRALSDYGKSIGMSASTFLKIIGEKSVENPHPVKTKDTRLFSHDDLVKKIAKGQSDSKVIRISKGEKKFYMRVLGDISRTDDSSHAGNMSVFASKLARVLSEKHFASEHMLSEGHSASRTHDFYVLPFTSTTYKPQIKELLQKGPVLGSGIVDEVCAFIHETDPNSENIGFSDTNFDDKTFISKIDFDRCRPFSEFYDPDSFDLYSRQLNRASEDIGWDNKDYLKERITARFKVALLSEECLTSLMDKHLGNRDGIDKIFAKCNTALSSISSNSKIKEYLGEIGHEETQKLLEEAKTQLIGYFDRHFSAELSPSIVNSLENRFTAVTEEINSKIFKLSVGLH